MPCHAIPYHVVLHHLSHGHTAAFNVLEKRRGYTTLRTRMAVKLYRQVQQVFSCNGIYIEMRGYDKRDDCPVLQSIHTLRGRRLQSKSTIVAREAINVPRYVSTVIGSTPLGVKVSTTPYKTACAHSFKLDRNAVFLVCPCMKLPMISSASKMCNPRSSS
ncbi:hypothetical protein EYC80_005279 [Monilinia laxa]|uniref:Uncharacterized protein n=1 Tax=Monilinia laxa TaxID=61186 RepID=A0A5N6KJE7_MONLA|nr:hypothetical protein EYC80_005279 [Monilinia laxa]